MGALSESYDAAHDRVGAPREGRGMQRFIAYLDRRNYAASTRRLYTRTMVRFHEWLSDRGLKLESDLAWKHVRNYASTLPHTYGSRNCFKSALRVFAVAQGWEDFPTWAVEVPKVKRGTYRGLRSLDEKVRLLEAAKTISPEAHAICCALYYQALRREECTRVRWSDIAAGRITGVGKGRLEFDRPLHPEFAKALEALGPEPGNPWVFPGRTAGGHISANTVGVYVMRAGERAGLGHVTPHQLRHTSIAAYQDAAGLRAAMEHARHTTSKHTIRYTFTTLRRERLGMEAL